MASQIRVISSMATRSMLAELFGAYTQASGQEATLESVGGVEAARRIQAGEPFDVVVLAADAIDKLMLAGHAVPGSRVDVALSGVAIAVRAGAPRPDISTEDAVRRAVMAAGSVSYSTGPSGVHLAHLFEAWGIADVVRERTVQAPPGVPVGSLLARGDAELGFQQLSELLPLSGIDVLGPLPPAIQIITTFSAARAASGGQAEAADALMRFLASPGTAAVKRSHGMEPA